MLKTGYFRAYHDYPEPEKDKILIMRNRGNDELEPSKNLLDDWKDDDVDMDWSDYKERFLKEMKSPESQKRIKELAKASHEKDIRLICMENTEDPKSQYDHCHRHIVAKLVRQAGGKVPSRKEREDH